MADVYSKEKRSDIMSRIKSRKTRPESDVAGLLRKLGIKYRGHVKSLPGQPDFVVASASTVIFVHGCFWHNHRNCKRARLPKTNRAFWKRKIDGNRRRDQRIARSLRKEGWHVVTVWQCQLRNHERVRGRLERLLG
jgi:DNA mismatch endonuclease (patch repair protein)